MERQRPYAWRAKATLALCVFAANSPAMGRSSEPAILWKSPTGTSVWAGSNWNRTQFAGPNFHPQLRPGHAGLILGPMDGSGPRQNFQQITLSRPAAPAPDHFEPLFAHIDQAREFDKLARSPVAGAAGGGPFVEIPAEPSVLIGLEYATSRLYGGHLTIKAIRPIFLGRGGESFGNWRGEAQGATQTVKAKDGYVVAGIVAKSGHRVDGIRLLFMRVKNGRLNPDETYRSPWLGGRGGGAESLYAANGDPIVGLHGRQGNDLDALGFMQAAIR